MAKRILVIDDIAFVRKTISDLLSKAHYQIVAEGCNGNEAVELYFKHKPDAVTMDIAMPELSGIEACQKICKKDPDAKIIMISALNQENIIMEAINAGARDFLKKPFTSEDLLKSTDHVLSGSEQAHKSAI